MFEYKKEDGTSTFYKKIILNMDKGVKVEMVGKDTGSNEIQDRISLARETDPPIDIIRAFREMAFHMVQMLDIGYGWLTPMSDDVINKEAKFAYYSQRVQCTEISFSSEGASTKVKLKGVYVTAVKDMEVAIETPKINMYIEEYKHQELLIHNIELLVEKVHAYIWRKSPEQKLLFDSLLDSRIEELKESVKSLTTTRAEDDLMKDVKDFYME